MSNTYDAMAYQQLVQYQSQLAQQMQYKTGLDLGFLAGGALGGGPSTTPMPIEPSSNKLLLLVEEESE